MGNIYTVGETTYDIIFRSGKPTGAVVGGSMLNTAVSLGRLGMPVRFITRMGNDQIGNLSMDFLTQNGVDCNYITRYDGNSRLALAFLDHENNAEYQFYKADKAPSLHFPELTEEDAVIFGSTNALRDEGRNSLLLFLNEAHDKKVMTIYDPNIREFGTLELIEVRRKFEENLHLTNVLKGSTQDFKRLYETSNADLVFDKVEAYGVNVLIITNADEPVELRTPSFSMSIPVHSIKVTNTIGAGDNFTAGLMYGFLTNKITSADIAELKPEIWRTIVNDASSFAAEVCKSDSNYISRDFAKSFLGV